VVASKSKLWLRLEHCWTCLKKCFGPIEADSNAAHPPHSEASNVKQNGWRQGSVIDDASATELTKGGSLPNQDAAGIWLVVSHDCDVTNHSFANEPNVEVIFGEVFEDRGRLDGNKKWGKNARMLQIELEGKTYEINASNRSVFPRVLLAKHTPRKPDLNREQVQQIVSWIARKYTRSAFPDEFNERIRPAASKLRKAFKKKGELLSALFLQVSDEELDESHCYELVIFGARRVEDYDDQEKRTEAQELLDRIEAELERCDGISVEFSDLRSEGDIGLADIRMMKRWESDIDLTLRDEGDHAIPPIE
jgi:hypothetical protein